jgi:hypothetical protein
VVGRHGHYGAARGGAPRYPEVESLQQLLKRKFELLAYMGCFDEALQLLMECRYICCSVHCFCDVVFTLSLNKQQCVDTANTANGDLFHSVCKEREIEFAVTGVDGDQTIHFPPFVEV